MQDQPSDETCARHSATRRSRYYDGPVSDHFDGVRFFDPAGAPPRSRGDLLRWMIESRWRAARARNGRPGRRLLMSIIHRCGSRVHRGASLMWAMRAGSFRPPDSTCCSTRCGRGAPRRSVWSGQSGLTIRASPLRICRRSTSCLCRTPTTITSTSRPCRGSPRRIARA